MFHRAELPALNCHQLITLYKGTTKGFYSEAGLAPAITGLSYT